MKRAVEQDMIMPVMKNDTASASPKFKGVVPQSNGNWGAQIYVNQRRVLLGTFKSEIDAAMAYDSASIKIRTADNQRNFPWSNITSHEPNFQRFYSADEILNMIKDGTYPNKFSEYVRSQIGGLDQGPSPNHDYSGFSTKLLFQKELTPSDVSKLNRLVVPKKYAVKYFPSIANGNDDNKEVEKMDEVHLVFYDRMRIQWKFRYCYWQSSQSFVFTRGWNQFVKEKNLKANDTIAFYVCESGERAKEGQSFFLIDFGCNGEAWEVEETGKNFDTQLDLCLRLGQHIVEDEEHIVEEEEDELDDDQCSTGFEATSEKVKKRKQDDEEQCSTRFEATPDKPTSFRLFGVEIN